MMSAGILDEDDEPTVGDIMVSLGTDISFLEKMERHRSVSLAITKMQEAVHWLQDFQREAAKLKALQEVEREDGE